MVFELARVALALGRDPGSKATLSTARRAAELWLRKQVDYIIMSGQWSIFSPDFDITEAQTMRDLAISLGVNPNCIWLDDLSRDTVSNMVKSREVLRRHGIRSGELIIVTIPHAAERAAFLGAMVFGGEFKIVVEESDYDFSLSPDEEARVITQEGRAFLPTWLSLLFVRPGNLRAIQRRLRLWHPGHRRFWSKVPQPITFA